ncbi:LuxR C-terminal-related transcriptional regulator [Gulosibacter sediminis]|uniref:LuxR C-terminal-related transcriptional regulator n=1 Tax=Gulosibacter sediminis TaxID=1729695 RepID=UPI001865A59D|nr:response regulator transcription factor [Gulosibacter sediminis]
MRVVVCEDHALLREGLVRLLREAGHEVVATLSDARGLTDAAADADIAVLDVRMPPTFTNEGVLAALELRRERPCFPVLVLSQYVEERYATELIRQPGAGLGYLLKDRVADIDVFLDALERIHAGEHVLDEDVIAQLLARRTSDDRLAALSPREREVLGLMAQGRSNAEIAGQLFVSNGAVEKYSAQIFQKLDLSTDRAGNRRVQAVLTYLEVEARQP